MNPPDTSETKPWTTSQVVFTTLLVVFVFLSFWLLYRFRAVVFILYIAIAIGTTMRPAVEWLYRRGLSRPAGIIVIYILIVCILAGFLSLFVPLIVDQATLFSQNFPQYQLDFRQALRGSNNLLLRNLGMRIPSAFNFFDTSNLTPEEVLGQVNQTFHYAGLITRGILSVLAVFLLAYYWTQESSFVIRNLLRFVPRAHRIEVREFIQKMEMKIGGYLRGQAILCLVVGFAAFISYSLIGLPYTFILAIFAGLMELIPIFGPVLGAIPAILVVIATQPEKAIWVVVATALIQAMENVFLVPRIMKSSMGVHPILILLSLITFSAVFGFPGALLALPLAAVPQLILERIVVRANESYNKDPSSDKEVTIQTLVDESETIHGVILKAYHDPDSSSHSVAEYVHTEILSISQEVDDLLKKMKSEEEEA